MRAHQIFLSIFLHLILGLKLALRFRPIFHCIFQFFIEGLRFLGSNYRFYLKELHLLVWRNRTVQKNLAFFFANPEPPHRLISHMYSVSILFFKNRFFQNKIENFLEIFEKFSKFLKIFVFFTTIWKNPSKYTDFPFEIQIKIQTKIEFRLQICRSQAPPVCKLSLYLTEDFKKKTMFSTLCYLGKALGSLLLNLFDSSKTNLTGKVKPYVIYEYRWFGFFHNIMKKSVCSHLALLGTISIFSFLCFIWLKAPPIRAKKKRIKS